MCNVKLCYQLVLQLMIIFTIVCQFSQLMINHMDCKKLKKNKCPPQHATAQR